MKPLAVGKLCLAVTVGLLSGVILCLFWLGLAADIRSNYMVARYTLEMALSNAIDLGVSEFFRKRSESWFLPLAALVAITYLGLSRYRIRWACLAGALVVPIIFIPGLVLPCLLVLFPVASTNRRLGRYRIRSARLVGGIVLISFMITFIPFVVLPCFMMVPAVLGRADGETWGESWVAIGAVIAWFWLWVGVAAIEFCMQRGLPEDIQL
jgi:hypothetical protein